MWQRSWYQHQHKISGSNGSTYRHSNVHIHTCKMMPQSCCYVHGMVATNILSSIVVYLVRPTTRRCPPSCVPLLPPDPPGAIRLSLEADLMEFVMKIFLLTVRFHWGTTNPNNIKKSTNLLRMDVSQIVENLRRKTGSWIQLEVIFVGLGVKKNEYI